MAWAGDCAYVAGDGIAVVDVSDPAHPRHVRTLGGAGSDATVETLHAVSTPERSILVTGRYGLAGHSARGGNPTVVIAHLSHCRDPPRLSALRLASNVHTPPFTAADQPVVSTLHRPADRHTDPRHPPSRRTPADTVR